LKIVALSIALFLPISAHANCRQALALGLDVSGSVDEVEYRQQLDGVAEALSSDAVSEVLFRQGSAPVRIAVFEWSGPQNQTLILPWTDLDTPETRDKAAERLRGFQRAQASPTTAIGSAMEFGTQILLSQDDCWRHTLDLSGDGEANTGPRPHFVTLPSPHVTINGLVIGTGYLNASSQRFDYAKALSSYYQSYVLRGPGAFVETALGFENYAEAMERKLVRELQSIAIGALPVLD
jgi:hypothetical protein